MSRRRAPRLENSTSLWLRKSHRAINVPLSRWDDYEYFRETLEDCGKYEITLVTVHWEPYADFVKYDFDDDDVRYEDDWAFVREVEARMRAGEDIPPLVRFKSGDTLDGKHRSFAAKALHINRAPTIYL